MKHRIASTLLSATLLLLAGALFTACDSNDDDASEAVADISAMFTRMQSALGVAFTPFGTKSSGDPQIIVDCPQGGTVDVQGSTPTSGQNSFSFDYSFTFDDCNDLDGTLTYEGTGTFAQDFSQFTYNVSMSGSLEAECRLTYNNYAQNISANLQTGETSFVMNGSFGATCGSSELTCSFDNRPLDLDGDNTSLFFDHCR